MAALSKSSASAHRWRGEQLLLPVEAGTDNAHMLDKHLRKARHSTRTGPVALKLRPQDRPGNRYGASLNHPPNCHLVGLDAKNLIDIFPSNMI
jgi:hypothetical protein